MRGLDLGDKLALSKLFIEHTKSFVSTVALILMPSILTITKIELEQENGLFSLIFQVHGLQRSIVVHIFIY